MAVAWFTCIVFCRGFVEQGRVGVGGLGGSSLGFLRMLTPALSEAQGQKAIIC